MSPSRPDAPDPLPRLANATLGRRRPQVVVPAYDRTRLQPGIVHLGLGAFFRAHGAEYTEDVLAEEMGAWGIVGVSLQRPGQRDRLVPQDGLYTLIAKGNAAPRARIVGSVLDVLVAPENSAAVLHRLADPSTRIVSLTITEKGYCHDPATGRFDEEHPDIRYDLANPSAPRSAIGFVVEALAMRRAAGLAPFTVLCCDNLPHNGALVHGLVRDFAALRDEHLARWIERNGAFPSTMVDRIVPATTDAEIADIARLTGLIDLSPVAHEPFRQWVVEDRFVDGKRPAWQRAGAELVGDVSAFETMKLRLLNGSHSALAYLGYLGGHETIGDCVGDGVYRAYLDALWAKEIIPVMTAPPGADLAQYTQALLVRYANPAIRHRTWQIAMDGSQKLPQRLLATVRERRRRGMPIPRLSHAIAAWMIYVGGVDRDGTTIDVRDPLLASIRAALETAGPAPRARIDALVDIEAIFGTDLAADAPFKDAVSQAYTRLASAGARAALADLG